MKMMILVTMVISIFVYSDEVKYNTAVSLIKDGKYSVAQTILDSLVIEEDSVRIRYALGFCCEKQDQLDRAMLHYRRAIAISVLTGNDAKSTELVLRRLYELSPHLVPVLKMAYELESQAHKTGTKQEKDFLLGAANELYIYALDAKAWQETKEKVEDIAKETNIVETVNLVELKPKLRSAWKDSIIIGELRNDNISEGIAIHAPCRLVYDIPKGMRHFTAIGINPRNPRGDHASFSFMVKIDGKEVFNSGNVKKSDKDFMIDIRLPISVKELELTIDTLGENWADRAIWSNPRFHIDQLTAKKNRGW